MANQVHLRFEFKYETKGAVRYQELDKHGNQIEIKDGAIIGPVYFRKNKLKGGIPMKWSAVFTEEE